MTVGSDVLFRLQAGFPRLETSSIAGVVMEFQFKFQIPSFKNKSKIEFR